MSPTYICLFTLFTVGRSLPSQNFYTYDGIKDAGPASIKEYPYVVSINETGSGKYAGVVTSGAILNKHWIVTSAERFGNDSLNNLRILAGSSLSVDYGQWRNVTKKIVHENYLGNYSYKIALLKTGGEFVFNKDVKPIALANSPPQAGKKYVVGFVGDSQNANTAYKLRVSTAHVFGDQADTYFTAHTKDVNLSKGAPLIDNAALVGYYLFGNIPDTTSSSQTQMYTDISALRSWILQTIRENSDGEQI